MKNQTPLPPELRKEFIALAKDPDNSLRHLRRHFRIGDKTLIHWFALCRIDPQPEERKRRNGIRVSRLSGRRAWPEEDIQRAKSMWEDGAPHDEIAKAVDRGVATLINYAHRHHWVYGVRAGYAWTEKELELLDYYISRNARTEDVARLLKRSAFTIMVKAKSRGVTPKYRNRRPRRLFPELNELVVRQCLAKYGVAPTWLVADYGHYTVKFTNALMQRLRKKGIVANTSDGWILITEASENITLSPAQTHAAEA